MVLTAAQTDKDAGYSIRPVSTRFASPAACSTSSPSASHGGKLFPESSPQGQLGGGMPWAREGSLTARNRPLRPGAGRHFQGDTQAQRNQGSKVRKARNWASLPAPRASSFRTLTLGHRNISNFLVFESHFRGTPGSVPSWPWGRQCPRQSIPPQCISNRYRQ